MISLLVSVAQPHLLFHHCRPGRAVVITIPLVFGATRRQAWPPTLLLNNILELYGSERSPPSPYIQIYAIEMPKR